MPHIIVTGGSSGIGAAIARIYAKRGADVSLIARRPDLLRGRAQALNSEGTGRVHWIACDVGDESALSAAVADCEGVSGPCDVLVTSAGIVEPAAFDVLSPGSFDRQLAVNLGGTVNAVRAVYSGMTARGRGAILMISSGAGLTGLYGYTAYCASKYAVRGFAEALRQEARPRGVSVSICFPPDTQTPQLETERLARPPEAQAIAGMSDVWQADAVARLAVKGVEKERFAIYPGLEMRALACLGPVFMPLLRVWFDRRIAAVQRRRSQGAD